MVWDRCNPVVSKHKLEVEHHLSVEELDVRHFRALQRLQAPESAFLERFGVTGIERVRALIAAEDAKQKQIEGTATDITDDYDEESDDEQ
jgi:hypothetical protein